MHSTLHRPAHAAIYFLLNVIICRVTKTACSIFRYSRGEHKPKSHSSRFSKLPKVGNGTLSPRAECWQGECSKTRRTDSLVLIKLSGLTYSIYRISVLLHLKQDGRIMQMSHYIVLDSETLSCMLGTAWIHFSTPECPQLWTVLVG